MYKINYSVKRTSATTDYLEINPDDMQTLQLSILGVLTYMCELSISKNKDVRDFTNWFQHSNKKYHFNNKLKKSNSPQSILAGTLNNLQFGNQRDFSLVQLEMIQEIINTSIDIIEAIAIEHEIRLQSKPMFTKIWIQEDLWQVS